jgi:hypothetical protein
MGNGGDSTTLTGDEHEHRSPVTPRPTRAGRIIME